MKPIQSFVVAANLPPKLERLRELAYNYWWCWNYHGKELFLRIDKDLWEEVDHNPVAFINKLPQAVLLELEQQTDFISYLDFVYDKFSRYMEQQGWFATKHTKNGEVIAYFSTEYGINESFPNYSGGLGVLSGDHLKSSSDLGLPLVAVGLLYQQGYFRQQLTQNGWQNEIYLYNDFYSMPLILQKDKNGEPIIISFDLPKGTAYAQIWKMKVGKVDLYLLDTNISQNTLDEYRDITDQLYGGNRDTRIQQEIILGIGGMRALRALGINPAVIHINEGHAAFALIERTRFFMEDYNIDFVAAKQISKSTSVFTTHTPVPAGNEVFDLGMIDYYLGNYMNGLNISREFFISLGQENDYTDSVGFSMTVLGLKMTGYHNGVSRLHGEVARKMWHKIWKCFPVNEVPIGHITNGIHTRTWLAREFSELFDRYLTPKWIDETDNLKLWENVENIPNEEIWREKQRRRTRLVLFARRYLQKKQRRFIPPEQLSKINSYLDPDALTIGFARRFAMYKRATLLFRDMERLSKILKDTERPVQIIIAGKAHPHDTQGKEVIQTIIQQVRVYGLERHVVFLEDYDMVIARLMIKGCDVWLNTPIRPLEASGTSGMKAAINGTLNLSVLDGWWDEAFDGSIGFAIGHGEEYENHEEQDIVESGSLYDQIEQVIVPMFYDRISTNRLPERGISYMKNSMSSIAGKFSTSRMVKEYTEKYYLPALNNFSVMTRNNAERASELKFWKEKIRAEWQNIKVISAEAENSKEVYVGKPIKVKAVIELGKLEPSDVVVQVYYGSINPHGELENTNMETLHLVNSENNLHFYEGVYECPDTGQQGFTIRILPHHELMVNASDLYACAWANGGN
jgi:starch phosphorylase